MNKTGKKSIWLKGLSIFSIAISPLGFFLDKVFPWLNNEIALGFLFLTLSLGFWMLFLNYFSQQRNLHEFYLKKNMEYVQLNAKSSVFYKVDAVKALRYINKNINGCNLIYNIRLREPIPIGGKEKTLDKITKKWRDKLHQIIQSNTRSKVQICEIVANHKTFIEETYDILSKDQNANISYECYLLNEFSKNIKIRNFTILESPHPLQEGETLKELFWGWHDPEEAHKGFLTYYTSDKEMVDDYTKRFLHMKNQLSTKIKLNDTPPDTSKVQLQPV